MRLYVFSSGAHQTPMGALQAGAGGMATIPVGFFLIQHPRGNVLFDTGNNDELITNPDYWGPLGKVLKPVRTPDVAIDVQLARIGVTPADVSHVVISHFHGDHAGNVGKFMESTFVYQLDEIRSAFWAPPGFAAGYLRSDFEMLHSEIGSPMPSKVDVIELNGDLDLFGDGTVCVHRAPSHTPGSQMLVVRLPNTGTVVLPGDAVYLKDNLEGDLLPAPENVYDPPGMLEGYEWVRRLQRTEKATVLFSHDPDEFKTYRRPPEFYD